MYIKYKLFTSPLQAAHHKLLSEDHLADQAVYSLQGQLKHLHQTLQAQTIIDLTVRKDVRPQALFLDLAASGVNEVKVV